MGHSGDTRKTLKDTSIACTTAAARIANISRTGVSKPGLQALRVTSQNTGE